MMIKKLEKPIVFITALLIPTAFIWIVYVLGRMLYLW